VVSSAQGQTSTAVTKSLPQTGDRCQSEPSGLSSSGAPGSGAPLVDFDYRQ